MKAKEIIHRGSDNIFADIGISHPERVQARAQVMFLMAEIIRKQGLTQKQAAAILGIPQSKVSCSVNGKLSCLSPLVYTACDRCKEIGEVTRKIKG